MMFCPKCGSILMAKKENNKIIVQCSCGFKEVKKEGIKLSEKSNKIEKEIEVIEKEVETHPICNEECEKCGNNKAFYWLQQTRAADEPPTKFLKCTKCKHTWRDYD